MNFDERIAWLRAGHAAKLSKPNRPIEGNGVFERWQNPVLTGAHAPLEWRYDLDRESNPYLMERFGIHATFNSGAIKWQGRYLLCVRVEGADRK